MRAHLYRVITNAAGDAQDGTVVRVLQPDALPVEAVPVTDPVFADKVGVTEAGTIFTATNGIIDVWMDTPQYVMLGLTAPLQVEYFVDNVSVLAPPEVIVPTSQPVVLATKSVAQDLHATPATMSIVLFDTESFDTDDMHSVASNTGRLTCVTPGYYSVIGKVGTTVAANYLYSILAVNGSSISFTGDSHGPITGSYERCTSAGLVYLDVGDYVELWASSSTASCALLVTDCSLSAHYVSV